MNWYNHTYRCVHIIWKLNVLEWWRRTNVCWMPLRPATPRPLLNESVAVGVILVQRNHNQHTQKKTTNRRHTKPQIRIEEKTTKDISMKKKRKKIHCILVNSLFVCFKLKFLHFFLFFFILFMLENPKIQRLLLWWILLFSSYFWIHA